MVGRTTSTTTWSFGRRKLRMPRSIFPATSASGLRPPSVPAARISSRERSFFWDHPWREPTPARLGSCRPGKVVRDCVILRLVGRGGASEVYRAIQRPLKRIVALKIMIGDRTMIAREASNSAFDYSPQRGRG